MTSRRHRDDEDFTVITDPRDAHLAALPKLYRADEEDAFEDGSVDVPLDDIVTVKPAIRANTLARPSAASIPLHGPAVNRAPTRPIGEFERAIREMQLAAEKRIAREAGLPPVRDREQTA